MAVQFMTGTPEEDLERLMQAVPGFRARKSGFAVSRVEGSKSCEKICQRKAELSEIDEKTLTARMERMSAKPLVSFCLPGHEERFYSLWEGHSLAADLNAMCASVYLLSADASLYERAIPAVDPDLIRFRDIHIRGVDLRGYILFHTAKGLYCGTKSGVKGGVIKRQIYYHGSKVVGKRKEDEYQRSL